MSELDRQRRRVRREAPERNGVAAAGKQPAAPAPEPVAVVRTLADMQARPVAWLWRPWIPLGALTLLDGDPGLGKSTMTLDIAARVSRGWAMPPGGGKGEAEPAGVLLLSAEDDLARTIRPRLDAAEADMNRVHALEAVKTGDDEAPPVLPYDLSLVEQLIADKGVKLVVVDPLMAYLDGGVDAHRDQDVRRCLHRLKMLAERTGVAVVLVRHLNKLIGGPAMYRGGGSIGIIGAVRSALVVGHDPANPHQCVLAPVKCNLAALPKSLLYTHEPVGDVARIGWKGESELTADDLVEREGGGRRPKAQQAAEAVRELLAGGPMASADLDAELAARGYGERAARAGRKLAGVKAAPAVLRGAWMASLPPAENAALSDEELADRSPFRQDAPE